MRIGDVKRVIYNHTIVEKYMLSSDKFTDNKCLNCSVFPICSGGCNKYRMNTSYRTNDICPLSEEALVRCFNINQKKV